jgi:hypothetical protein
VNVTWIARKHATPLSGFVVASQDGNPIPAFLAVPDAAVARGFQCTDWKVFVDGFEFLQTNNIGASSSR